LNTIDVECAGPGINVTLDDEVIIAAVQDSVPQVREKPRKGYVCPQNHGGTIEFRSVRVREIGPKEKPPREQAAFALK
jgi:hypothetical protein